jgi:hypothetical protein
LSRATADKGQVVTAPINKDLPTAIASLHAHRGGLEQAWEGYFVPQDTPKELQEQTALLHRLEAVLLELVETVRGTQAKAEGEEAPPDQQADLAKLEKFFTGKRDEIARHLPP